MLGEFDHCLIKFSYHSSFVYPSIFGIGAWVSLVCVASVVRYVAPSHMFFNMFVPKCRSLGHGDGCLEYQLFQLSFSSLLCCFCQSLPDGFF